MHWEIREQMTELDVECVMQRARERFPSARPRIISDNGPQFIAKDFKEFIRVAGMTHVRTAPYYPQSNGKLERWHGTVKSEAIRVTPPTSLDEARAVVARFVEHYNGVRLHSAIGYITPNDLLAGRRDEIHAAAMRSSRLPGSIDANVAPQPALPDLHIHLEPGVPLAERGERADVARGEHGGIISWRDGRPDHRAEPHVAINSPRPSRSR